MKSKIVIGLFVVTIIIVLAIFVNNEKTKRTSLSRLLEQTVSKSADLYIEQNYRNTEIFLNGKNVVREFSVSDGKGHPAEWNEIIQSNKLILFFSEGSCEDCINLLIEQLKAKESSLGTDKVLIMINATGKRYVSQYKSQTSLEYPIWEITTNFNSLISPPPFFFVVEKESMRINSSYIPQKEKPEEISRYLDKIIADYFNPKIE